MEAGQRPPGRIPAPSRCTGTGDAGRPARAARPGHAAPPTRVAVIDQLEGPGVHCQGGRPGPDLGGRGTGSGDETRGGGGDSQRGGNGDADGLAGAVGGLAWTHLGESRSLRSREAFRPQPPPSGARGWGLALAEECVLAGSGHMDAMTTAPARARSGRGRLLPRRAVRPAGHGSHRPHGTVSSHGSPVTVGRTQSPHARGTSREALSRTVSLSVGPMSGGSGLGDGPGPD